jgi:hypothetical protein
MKQIPIFLLIAIFPVISFGQSGNDIQMIKNTFSNYKKSILASDGSEAVKWVDTKTVVYYGKMLQASLHADSAQVQNLGLMDKLIVLIVRHKVPKNEIEKMNGNEFFVYAINQGMVGKNSVMNIEIGEVKVNNNFANGQIMSGGQKSPLFFQFNKEEGQWKIDITSLFPASTAGLKKVISDNGMTENDFIFKTLEMLTGSAVGNEIWQPMK